MWGTHLTFRSKAILFLATGCGIGCLPKGSGTFGTFLGIPLAYGVSLLSLPKAVIATLLIIVLSILIAHNAEKMLKKKDPGIVVIDEIAGMLVTLSGLGIDWTVVILGFIFFRILDIFKPFPISWLDLKVSGGLGIVADDIAAGVISNIILRIGLYTIGG
jgi:phosphatidylglycerophosphatase A